MIRAAPSFWSGRSATPPRGAFAILLPTVLAACAAVANGAPLAQPATLARIDALIGAAWCDADAQCRVAPIGHRSCGGPESFRAWSARDTQPAALETALRDHARERQRQQELSGEMSTCNVLPIPSAACMPATPGTGGARCALSGASGIR